MQIREPILNIECPDLLPREQPDLFIRVGRHARTVLDRNVDGNRQSKKVWGLLFRFETHLLPSNVFFALSEKKKKKKFAFQHFIY